MTLTPQQKAAQVSGRNRSRRAQEVREREQRRADLLAEHDRGEHTAAPYNVSCAKCLALYYERERLTERLAESLYAWAAENTDLLIAGVWEAEGDGFKDGWRNDAAKMLDAMFGAKS